MPEQHTSGWVNQPLGTMRMHNIPAPLHLPLALSRLMSKWFSMMGNAIIFIVSKPESLSPQEHKLWTVCPFHRRALRKNVNLALMGHAPVLQKLMGNKLRHKKNKKLAKEKKVEIGQWSIPACQLAKNLVSTTDVSQRQKLLDTLGGAPKHDLLDICHNIGIGASNYKKLKELHTVLHSRCQGELQIKPLFTPTSATADVAGSYSFRICDTG